MSAVPHLRPVTDDDLLVNPATGEPVDASYRIRDLEDELSGYKATCSKQARQIGALTRRLDALEDPDHQPANSEVIALIERWRTAHPKATVSRDRVKLVKARLADGFLMDSEDELPSHPTLELAVDGVLSHPFLVFGKRRREGAKSNRYDDLKDALGDAAKVEESARAGYLARKQGWTLEGGWPRTDREAA
jgi:hypothetical protein